MNKVCISIINCHPENRFKIEAFWFVFKSFCHQILINFPKKIRLWGKQKKAHKLSMQSNGIIENLHKHPGKMP